MLVIVDPVRNSTPLKGGSRFHADVLELFDQYLSFSAEKYSGNLFWEVYAMTRKVSTNTRKL